MHQAAAAREEMGKVNLNTPFRLFSATICSVHVHLEFLLPKKTHIKSAKKRTRRRTQTPGEGNWRSSAARVAWARESLSEEGVT